MRAGGVPGGILPLGQSTARDKMTENPSKTKPIRDRRLSPRDWSISDVPERQCTAHKRNGDRCRNAAIRSGSVCGYHGGNAPAVKAKARLRLEMASDRLARQLLNMTSDPNVADPVKLAAIKDALDRSGLAAKNAVSVEVGITKPFERVFDSIIAGPREPTTDALAIESAEIEDADADDEIVGEIDADEIEDDLPRIQPQRQSESAEIVDVEIVDAGYTDAAMTTGPGTATPDQDQTDLSVDLGATPYPGPLGPTGPAGSGLMRLEDAVQAQAAMRAREAARIRDMRRR
jgi:hypothetical protein